jgi:hypothetical protein
MYMFMNERGHNTERIELRCFTFSSTNHHSIKHVYNIDRHRGTAEDERTQNARTRRCIPQIPPIGFGNSMYCAPRNKQPRADKA